MTPGTRCALAFLLLALAVDLGLGLWTGAAVPPPRPSPAPLPWPERAWRARVVDRAGDPANPLGLSAEERRQAAADLDRMARSGRAVLATSSALLLLLDEDRRPEFARLDRDLADRAVLLRRPVASLGAEALQALGEGPDGPVADPAPPASPGPEGDPARLLAVLLRLQDDPARRLTGDEASRAASLVRRLLRDMREHDEAWEALRSRAGDTPPAGPPPEDVSLEDLAGRAGRAAAALGAPGPGPGGP